MMNKIYLLLLLGIFACAPRTRHNITTHSEILSLDIYGVLRQCAIKIANLEGYDITYGQVLDSSIIAASRTATNVNIQNLDLVFLRIVSFPDIVYAYVDVINSRGNEVHTTAASRLRSQVRHACVVRR